MATGRALLRALPAVAAVGTLPVGILAGLFAGLEAAVVVFLVGWLLLVPLGGVLSQHLLGERETRAGVVDAMEGMIREEIETDERAGESEPERDPIETLRERYAAGEIDDVEFERRLEDLVATEGVEVPPEVDVAVAEDAGIESTAEAESTDGARERGRKRERERN